jgi:hypothetical protein
MAFYAVRGSRKCRRAERPFRPRSTRCTRTFAKTQLERIKAKLARDGYVTRNECLSQFPAITRLGARIDDLERQGYVFQTENTGRDYVYKLITSPTRPFV